MQSPVIALELRKANLLFNDESVLPFASVPLHVFAHSKFIGPALRETRVQNDLVPEIIIDYKMRLTRSIICVLALLSITGVYGAPPEFSIVQDGQPTVSIVVPPGASEQFIASTNQFVDEMRKASGVSVPIVSAIPVTGNRIEFSVENRSFLERGKYNITFPEPNVLHISGSNISIRWALNSLLEAVGIKYVLPGEDGAFYPQLSNFGIPQTASEVDAAFKLYRGLFAEDVDWQHALNCEGGDSYELFNHNIDTIFPIAKYGTGEWIEKIMPLRGGKRLTSVTKGAWEPCYSNPSTAAEAVKTICAYFEEHPEKNTFSLSINDGYNLSCECEACRKENEASPGENFLPDRYNYSDSYYGWVNRVAEGVSARFPDKYLGTLAYTGVINPPSFKLHPNVVVVIAFESYACIDPEVSSRWKALRQRWREKAALIGMWDYTYGISYFTLPKIYFHQQALVLREVAAEGMAANFVEGMPSLSEGPKRWLNAKLLYNPNIEIAPAVHEWCAAAVGKAAAEPLVKYFNFWEHYWTERATKTEWFRSTRFGTYTALIPDGGYVYALVKGDIAHCREWMEDVVAKADQNGDKSQKLRARQLMQTFEFYEASAYLSGAEIIPISGALENKAQALELAQNIPKIASYSLRRAEIAQSMLKTLPDWWGGLKFYRSNFLSQFGAPGFPQCFFLLAGWLDDADIQKAFNASLQDPGIPESWTDLLRTFSDIATGKSKNILQDGSFEQGLDGWGVVGKPSMDFSSVGKRSAKVSVVKEGKFEMVRQVPMTPGRRYYFSAKIYIPSDYPPEIASARCYILGINEKGVGSNYYVPATIKLIPGKWTTVSTTADPGKSAGFGNICLYIDGMKNGEIAYIDDALLVEVEEAR